MADTNEPISKFYFVLPGLTYSAGRYKEGEVVELLEEQANGWVDVVLSKGYKTEAGARKASGHVDAPEKDAKEAVTNGS